MVLYSLSSIFTCLIFLHLPSTQRGKQMQRTLLKKEVAGWLCNWKGSKVNTIATSVATSVSDHLSSNQVILHTYTEHLLCVRHYSRCRNALVGKLDKIPFPVEFMLWKGAIDLGGKWWFWLSMYWLQVLSFKLKGLWVVIQERGLSKRCVWALPAGRWHLKMCNHFLIAAAWQPCSTTWNLQSTLHSG